MKKSVWQILLLLMVVGLILSVSLSGVSAVEVSEAEASAASGDSGWTLQINVVSSNETVTLSLDEIVSMPKTVVQAELSCYGEYITSGAWGGVKLSVLFGEIGFNESTANLQFFASDGYTTTHSFSKDTTEDVIIAYELGGGRLAEKLRLVIPGANGEAWIAWITAISISTMSESASPPTAISINGPTYSSSPNPQAASIGPNQYSTPQYSTPQQSPTPKPSPEPELGDLSTVQPTVTPPADEVQQQDTSSSSLQTDYGYPILLGTVIAATAALGCLLYKRRK